MPTYYVDTTGDNSDGSTLAKAYTGLASALAAVAAGDEIRFVSSVAQSGFTWGATGTAAARITLVGGLNVGGVWSETGARAVLDPNGAATILTIGAKNYITIRNVTFRRATHSITAGGNWNGMVIDNCLFELNAASGLSANGVYSFGGMVRKTSFLNNTYAGTNGPNAQVYNGCIATGNGTYGISGEYIEVENSVIANNTNAAGAGLNFGYANYGGGTARHCVFYGNNRAAVNYRASQSYVLSFNKWLSNTTGLVLAASSHAILANNGWNGNGAKTSLGAGAGIINVTGELDMAAHGCVNPAGGNFNNSATSEGLFVATSIDGTNYTYEHIGLPYKPAPVSTSSASFSSCSDSSNSFSESSASYANPSASSQSSRSQSSDSQSSRSNLSGSSSSQSSRSDSSDSSSFMITAGSDSIQAQITANIKAALKLITIANGYNYDVARVEELRKIQEMNDNLPFVLLIEGDPQKDSEDSCVIRTLNYQVWYFPKDDDRVTGDNAADEDTEITYTHRNIMADVAKALSVDPYRGIVDGTTHARAENTLVDPGYPEMYLNETLMLPGFYCDVRVMTNIDVTNPYQLRQGA